MRSFHPAGDPSSHLCTLLPPVSCEFRRENAALLNRERAHSMQSQKNKRHRRPHSLPQTNSCQQNPRKLSRTNSCLSSKMLQTHVFPEDKSLAEERWLLWRLIRCSLGWWSCLRSCTVQWWSTGGQIPGLTLLSLGSLYTLCTPWFLPGWNSPSWGWVTPCQACLRLPVFLIHSASWVTS